MAINPGTQWPGQTTAPDADYPYGSSKNETAPGANDGTPYEKIRADDLFGMHQSMLKIAGIVPTGNADTAADKNSSQYMQALLHLVTAGYTFDESGVADVYVLDVVGNNPAPADYTDNMTLVFIPTNTNTGASTVDVESLGVKDIVIGGVALAAGILAAGFRYTIVFDLTNDRFELVVPGANLGQALAFDLTLNGGAASPPDPNTLVKENIVKAWINFDGTGTISIYDSYNIASIVDNGVGDYDLNFDTDFADTNYVLAGSAEATVGNFVPTIVMPNGATRTVGTAQIRTTDASGTNRDFDFITIIAIGNQ